MTARDIGVLAMRVLALFVIVRGLYGLSFAVEMWLRSQDIDAIWNMGGVSNIVQMLIGLVIWASAGPLAAMAQPLPSPEDEEEEEADEAEPSPRVSALDVHAIAFSVLGLYLMAEGFAQVGQSLATIAQLRDPAGQFGVETGFQTLMWTQAATAIFLAIAGLAIALGARGLAAFFRRIWFEGRWVVRTRRVEVVDDDSRPRLILEAQEDGPRIEFLDEAGEPIPGRDGR